MISKKTMYNENDKHKSFINSAIEQTKLARAFYDSFVEEWVYILKEFLALPDEILFLEQDILSYEQNFVEQNFKNSKFMLLHFDASNMRNQIIKFIKQKNDVMMYSQKIWLKNQFINISNIDNMEGQYIINDKVVKINITDQTSTIRENLQSYENLQKKYPTDFQQIEQKQIQNSLQIRTENINMSNLYDNIHMNTEDALLEIMLKVGLCLQIAHDDGVFFANINPFNIFYEIDDNQQTKVQLAIPNILHREYYTEFTSGTQLYSQDYKYSSLISNFTDIFKDLFVYTNTNQSDIISFTKILYYFGFQNKQFQNMFVTQTYSMNTKNQYNFRSKIKCVLQQISVLQNSKQLRNISQINELILQQLYVGFYQKQEKIQQINYSEYTLQCKVHLQINKYSFENRFVCIECIIGMQQQDQQNSIKKNKIDKTEFRELFKQLHHGKQMLNSFQMKVQNIIRQIQ